MILHPQPHCTSSSHFVSGQAADETDETLFLTFRSEELKRMCPGGVKKCHCAHSPGTYIDGPFDYKADPIGTVLTYGGCNPDFCTCNGSDEEFDARRVRGRETKFLSFAMT